MFKLIYTDDDDNYGLTDNQSKQARLIRLILRIIKIGILISVWMFFTILLIIKRAHTVEKFCISVQKEKMYNSSVTADKAIEVDLGGRIDEHLHENPSMATDNLTFITVWVQQVDKNSNQVLWKGNEWKVYLLEKDSQPMTSAKRVFQISKNITSNGDLQLVISTTSTEPVSLFVILDTAPIDKGRGVIYACVLLVFLYVLIIWDIIDRTFAALLTSAACIGVLAGMDARPSLYTLVSWIDVHTLMLLFAMMILVAIFSETGIFDYVAVLAYRYSKGHAWPLMFFLCILTGFTSAFLDNVTVVLLLVPVTIRLCEVMALNTVTVLITVVIFSNIGGTMTPVGDPPNVIIATNSYVCQNGINFFNFTVHMFFGVILAMIVAFAAMYCLQRKKIMKSGDSTRVSIRALNKEMAKISPSTAVEDQMRANILKHIQELKEKNRNGNDSTFFQPVPSFIETLAELEVKYKIRDKPLLIKSCIALSFAVLLFLILPFLEGAKLSWIAICAAFLLVILANIEDMQIVLLKLEWSTLLFFAAMFIIIESCSKMGLIDWIGDRTVAIILSVSKKHQLLVAVTLILWISAITSAFIDNIPITTMLLRLAIYLSRNPSLALPVSPLIWALSFGACLGGNGTLIGASANIVTAGLAAQHGYKITFLHFFLFGFPIMIATIIVVWIYLLIAHIAFAWH